MNDLSIMLSDVKFNYRVGLIIEKDNKIYIESNDNEDIDFVTLPGGRVKTLESSIEAIKREIYEETGVILSSDELFLTSIIENFFTLNNIKYHELYFLYKLKLENNDVRFVDNILNKDSKNSHFKWVDKSLDGIKLLPAPIKGLLEKDDFEIIVNKDLL